MTKNPRKIQRNSTKDKEEILQEFKTNQQKGLTNKQAEEKLEKDGENIVVKTKNIHGFTFYKLI